jgi:hypothetical protein
MTELLATDPGKGSEVANIEEVPPTAMTAPIMSAQQKETSAADKPLVSSENTLLPRASQSSPATIESQNPVPYLIWYSAAVKLLEDAYKVIIPVAPKCDAKAL